MIETPYPNYFWWIGVVEDRLDPLFLGRCRVRIVGFHNPDASVLPTEDLPWAYPIQSITSAGMSGVGTTPLGVVEGSWVTGFFRDGESFQEPVFTGVMGGVPQPDTPILVEQSTFTPDVLSSPSGENYSPTNPPPDAVRPVSNKSGVIGPLTEEQLSALFAVLRQRESTNNYGAVNPLGFLGAYQFGVLVLIDAGYVKKNVREAWDAEPKNDEGLRADYARVCLDRGIISQSVYNSIPDKSRTYLNFFTIANDTMWTDRAGGSSQAFLNSVAIQERCVRDTFSLNYRRLLQAGVLNDQSEDATVAGYLFVSHLLGTGGAIDLFKGVDGSDSSGNASAVEYFELGYTTISNGRVKYSLAANEPSTPPKKNTSLIKRSGPNTTTGTLGFVDPNRVYPRIDHIGEPDTNRLARNQSIGKTIVSRKDATRTTGIPVAVEGTTWEQPRVPYNAKYPYNHVIETESGHIIEYDDTPGNERIHLWHTQGTFIEIDRNGTFVQKVTGDAVFISERNEYAYVKGRLNLTVDGVTNVYVKNDCNLQVDGTLRQQVHGDMEINVARNLKITAGGSIQAKSGGNTNIESGKNLNLKAANSVKVDGLKVAVKGGASIGLQAGSKLSILAPAVLSAHASFKVTMPPIPGFVTVAPGGGATGAGVEKPVDRRTPKEKKFPPLALPTRAEEAAYSLSALGENPETNAPEIKKLKKKLSDDGVVDIEEFRQEPSVLERDDTPPPKKEAVGIEVCAGVFDTEKFKPSFQLSTNYTLDMLSSNARVSKYRIRAQHGLSEQDIVCNLIAVAQNVLEPIRKKYPNVIVTSGFRSGGGGARVSQHEKGQAIDLQFINVEKAQYYEIAKWIRDNVLYDQMLLEYKTYASGNPWIHISYNRDGCRNTCSTFFNNTFAPNGRGVLLNLA
jgi:hypothetical protein